MNIPSNVILYILGAAIGIFALAFIVAGSDDYENDLYSDGEQQSFDEDSIDE